MADCCKGNSSLEPNSNLSRRDFFSRVGDGLYGVALASLFEADLLSSKPALAAAPEVFTDLRPRSPHFPAKAKAVIQLFMHGGPSQVDLFDPKPMLEKHAGQPPSRDLANDILFVGNAGGMMPSPFKFAKHGQSGTEISEAMPHLAKHVDDIAVIRSMFTTNFTHGPAVFLMHGGRIFPDRPTLGAWVVYGVGSENQNLPAYVVLDDPKGLPTVGIRNWQSGWLPPVFQGTRLRSEGSPMLNLKPPEGVPQGVLDLERSLLGRLAAAHRDSRPGVPDLQARISSYELAARMQLSATDALDLSQESEATRQMYGLNDEVTASYGRRCLMARRLVERGVRMVQIYCESQIWDNHNDLEDGLNYCCGKTDKPVAALLADLKQRGLYDSTLVVWGGEFGRLPLSQIQPGREKNAGRDHGPAGFTVWMGGGGVKGGTTYGATDDLGYKAVENRVSVHDFHATILHLLGLDFTRLVYNNNGLNEKLTGQEPARVVKEILA
jgi:hypothetical protein